MEFEFRTVERIIFGPGVVRRLAEVASSFGKKAFVVTGRSFLRQSGWLEEIETLFRQANLSLVVHQGIPPEPTLADTQRAIDEARSAGPDVVIGIGGGSAIDVAKTVASTAPFDGSVYEYFRGRQIERKGLAFIAVPTTSGSGSEVTPNSVLIDETTGVKSSIRSNFMYADVALVDPALTLTAPKETTAYAGMDALCQAIEAYVSKGANPITDALALDASVRLFLNLPKVYSDPKNLELRTQVALGSLMGGIAFANARLGLAHGLAHPLGVRSSLPHGLVCALLLPLVMRFNMPVCSEKYAAISRISGIAQEPTYTDMQAAEAFISAIERLNEDMRIKAHYADLKMDPSEWTSVIKEAMASGSTRSNPREVSASDIEAILASF